MFAKNVFVACICCYLLILCDADEKQTGWSQNSVVFANSSVAWYPRKEKIASSRAFHVDSSSSLNNNNNNGNNNHLDDLNSAFGFNTLPDRDDFKAVPVSSDSQSNPAGTSAHFHAVIKPPATQVFSSPQSSYSVPQTSYGAPQQSYGPPRQQQIPQSYFPSSYYTGPQYLPPVTTSQPLHIETLDSYQPTYTNLSTNFEVNSKNQLFIQPGKCSNSIEVGRTRDVEVRTAFKYGTDPQKGVCVLMLYAANEQNKLAISMQPVQGTTNIIPTGTWLETNVKIYALQAGDIQPILTTQNFGPNSPALILTRSNIVIFSFYVDRSVDFFLDISTYQSLTC